MKIKLPITPGAWTFIITAATLSSGCAGGGDGSLFVCRSSASTYLVLGRVQKGPFVFGAEININSLDTTLSPTGTLYNIKISDALGEFALSSLISAPQVEIVAQGFYFDEIGGRPANARIQTRTISDLSVNNRPTGNVLTTLQEQRLKPLTPRAVTSRRC